METNLITKEELRAFWPISKNINEDRIDPYILRAQQRELKPFLGSPLYYDLCTDPTSTTNTELLNGGEYELDTYPVFFNGLKPLIAAFAYAQFLVENPISVNRSGNKNKTDDSSTEIDATTTELHANAAKSEAIRLQAEAAQYLNEKQSDFPLWRKGSDTNSPTESSVRFSRVPRKTQI